MNQSPGYGVMTRVGSGVWLRPETSRVETIGLGDGLVLTQVTEGVSLHDGEHCSGALSAKSNPLMSLCGQD